MKLLNKITILKAFGLTLMLGICMLPAAAQTGPNKLPPSITTTGEAVVTAKPDRAQLDIGVASQAATSEAAVTDNAQKVTATLAKLHQVLGSNAEIKTISYTVSPDYKYPKEGGEPSITGYTATNVVRVTLDDLAQVGKAIDAATGSGANRIQNLRFSIKDEQVVQSQALREAAVKARQKAEALADALGLKIQRVLSVTENSQGAVPFREVAFARADAASTPIEPGTIEIHASVTYTVEIGG
jgi:uncharacterized protein YggE